MPFCGIPKCASGMIDPDDYQQPQDQVGWTCIREPLGRWLDGIFTDYPQWHQRRELLKDFNHPEDPFALQKRLQQMNRDHLAGQWSTLNNDYQWEEIEIWPMHHFDHARQENGARWSRHLRDDPLGAPWQISPTRVDHIRDFVNRINDTPRLIQEWCRQYDRDRRMWQLVEQHWQNTQEPLVLTRRQFQSRVTWPMVEHLDDLVMEEVFEGLAVPD